MAWHKVVRERDTLYLGLRTVSNQLPTMKPGGEKELRGHVYYDRFPEPTRFSPLQEYPEPVFTTIALPDRRAPFHCRLSVANRVMNADSQRVRFKATTSMQTAFNALLDHKEYSANGAVQLIAGLRVFRAAATVVRRSGTGPAKSRAGRVPSLPLRAIHSPRLPAIPDGGRSLRI